MRNFGAGIAARDYINNPRALRKEKHGLVVSKIFEWYSDDFGTSKAELKAHWKKYLEHGKVLSALENGAKIHKYEYNWELNGDDGK